ncbi:Chorismate synthase [Mucinivorans hirudinis]|uniref:Chorismate synthase n=1 Tax=Mucinivorans hirudinis TaxID=1433126 RepID=A0A060R842_9BACT|nr:Chorismate synthase [Mucinivorans hirudinis]
MNSFGRKYRISIFGESHGDAVGVVIDGTPAGIALTEADFTADLDRRRSGAKGTTPRKESDAPHIVSGIYNGLTTGAPLTILFRNENTLSGDYRNLTDHPRPSHSDFVARVKYGGYNDPRGGGHFSGRITLGLVAAGVVAKKIIPDINIVARILEIGGCSENIAELIDGVIREQDSLGGVIECRAAGVPVGLGEPFFDSVESVLSHMLFSIPAIKGIEFGTGFGVARMRGSENNDAIIDPCGTTATNNGGGIAGGITNGNELVVRVAVKPTASISQGQQTYNFASNQVEELKIKGRHDACIALRAPVILEAATAIVLADFSLLNS